MAFVVIRLIYVDLECVEKKMVQEIKWGGLLPISSFVS